MFSMTCQVDIFSYLIFILSTLHWTNAVILMCNHVRFKVAVDNLEVCCMDPDMELHYKELLLQWKNDEDNIKDELKDIGVDIKEISTDIKTLTKKFDDLVESNESSASETGDVKIPKY